MVNNDEHHVAMVAAFVVSTESALHMEQFLYSSSRVSHECTIACKNFGSGSGNATCGARAEFVRKKGISEWFDQSVRKGIISGFGNLLLVSGLTEEKLNSFFVLSQNELEIAMNVRNL